MAAHGLTGQADLGGQALDRHRAAFRARAHRGVAAFEGVEVGGRHRQEDQAREHLAVEQAAQLVQAAQAEVGGDARQQAMMGGGDLQAPGFRRQPRRTHGGQALHQISDLAGVGGQRAGVAGAAEDRGRSDEALGRLDDEAVGGKQLHLATHALTRQAQAIGQGQDADRAAQLIRRHRVHVAEAQGLVAVAVDVADIALHQGHEDQTFKRIAAEARPHLIHIPQEVVEAEQGDLAQAGGGRRERRGRGGGAHRPRLAILRASPIGRRIAFRPVCPCPVWLRSSYWHTARHGLG